MRRYAPALEVNVCSPVPISHFVAQVSDPLPSKPFVAVGDGNGVVHVMEVPPGYAIPSANEVCVLPDFLPNRVFRLSARSEPMTTSVIRSHWDTFYTHAQHIQS